MAGTIANLIVNIHADTAELKKGVEQANKSIDGFTKSISKVGTMMASAFTVGAIIGAGKALVDYAGKLTDLSAKTGISTTGLQKLNLAFEQSGVSLDAVTKASGELGARIATGDKSAVSALQKLGLSVEALKKMTPEDQFLTVADAIGNLQNKGEQLAVSKTLFGKGGAELLQGLTGNLKETTDEFENMGLIISEDTIAAADEFGDQLGLMGKQLLGVVANIVGPLLPALSFLLEALMSIGGVLGQLVGFYFRNLFGALATAQSAILGFLATIVEAGTRIPIVGKHLGGLGDAAGWLREQAAKADATADKLFQTTEKTGEAAKAAAPPVLDLGKAKEKVAKSTDLASTALGWMFAKLEVMPGALEDNAASTHILASEMGDLALAMNAVPFTNFNQHISETIPATEKAKGAFESFVGGFKGGLKDLWNGITGTDADGKSLGVAGLFNNLGAGIMDGFGSIITGGLSSLINVGVGLAMKGLGKLGGAIKGLFGGGEHSKVNDLRDKFIDAAGGLQALNEKAHEAGTSLDELLAAKKVSDFERAVANLNSKMGQFADEQAADAARLEEAIEKYGFAFEELGPKFQQQKLHEQAVELIEDWRVLVDSGIDVAVVNEKMAESVNEYLQMAIKTGTEVPVAMKPILQSFIDQGLLVDENGTKITDLGATGVTFSETMTQGFDRVVRKLEELIQRIGDTGTAIDDIPDQVDISVGFDVQPFPGLDIPQDFLMPLPMAKGGSGTVTKPTLFLAGEAGPEQFAFSGANRQFSGGMGPGALKETNRRLAALPREFAREVAAGLQEALLYGGVIR